MKSALPANATISFSGLVFCALLGGCAGSKAAGPQAQPVAAPALSAEEERERQQLEQVFRNLLDVPADAAIAERLRDPKTVQDAQDVVRSDNIALYPKADKLFAEYLASHPEDITNLTWHAQLYLAWADAAIATRQSLAQSLERLRQEQQAGQAGDRLEQLAWTIGLAERAQADLDAVAREKLGVGAAKALAILKLDQESYEGYRLAADLFRLNGDWTQHEKFMKKLEARNPDSVGLRFQKGVVAYCRDQDLHQAERYLKEALAKDPQFAKAQYYLALTYLSMHRYDHAREALEQTLRISPGHPLANAIRGYVQRVKKI
ncbi:MAG: tetratricopeptide repeat protein [Deltaproteobacteria bacterium]|nr:tetratricopeptide repeat protein [Deltaproteobacteria bacterium]